MRLSWHKLEETLIWSATDTTQKYNSILNVFYSNYVVCVFSKRINSMDVK